MSLSRLGTRRPQRGGERYPLPPWRGDADFSPRGESIAAGGRQSDEVGAGSAVDDGIAAGVVDIVRPRELALIVVFGMPDETGR